MKRWKNSAKPLRLGVEAFILLGAVIIMGIGSQHMCQAFAGSSMPFAPGERLRFHLRWTVVPAGKAIMEVLPMKTIDDTPVYHFRLTAKSNAFVDIFYKVRDRIDAYASADMTHAVRYYKKQHEGQTRRDVKVEFDWKKEKARYSDGKTNKKIDIIPGTFDPLSVFYYTRMVTHKENDIIERPVSDGKKCVYGMAHVVKKETITILSGTYETFLIEPDLKHVGGVFEKDKNAKIKLWVTADERRIPVKIASKVAIGSFVGELIAIEKGDS
jgi:hypothetical protein